MSETRAFIAGVHEYPDRNVPGKSTFQLHAEVAREALRDAGLSKDNVDGYLTAFLPEEGDGFSSLLMADFLGLDISFTDTTDIGGSSYVSHVAHAASAIQNGKCDVALVTFAGRPRSRDQATGSSTRSTANFETNFEQIYGVNNLSLYALAAKRHMYEFGTTSEQLAEIRVAAAHHAQYNENALYSNPVTVEEVLESDLVADPLRVLDCCVITDGGGAVVVVSKEVKDNLDRDCVEVLGHGEAVGHQNAGRINVTSTAASNSGPRAFAEAGLTPGDVDYASIYDSFTITVLETIEDLGFCNKGDGGSFVENGTLQAPDGALPINTDGGGLCSNHPNRGGMIRTIEAVRQLRGEANEPVQIRGADIALVHGTGGELGRRHSAVTLLLGGPEQ